MTTLDLIGWIGAASFAVCAIPQAYHCWRTNSADDVNWIFLGLWLLGEVSMIVYVMLTSMDPIFLVNYLTNLLCLLVILRVKIYS